MNKITVLKDLERVANYLDSKNFKKEAAALTKVMYRVAFGDREWERPVDPPEDFYDERDNSHIEKELDLKAIHHLFNRIENLNDYYAIDENDPIWNHLSDDVLSLIENNLDKMPKKDVERMVIDHLVNKEADTRSDWMSEDNRDFDDF